VSYEIKTGDTHPPLTVKLEESTDATDPVRYRPTDPDTGELDDSRWVRRVDLFTIATRPDSFRIILKLTSPSTTVVMANANIDNVEVVSGAGTLGGSVGVEPGNGIGANRGLVRGKWQAGQTDQAGTYAGETEVTWDSASTPPAIETFPNDQAKNFTVIMSPDLD
jgi:hypothetical protein